MIFRKTGQTVAKHVRIFASLTMVIFFLETLVMYLLPILFPDSHDTLLNFVDAMLLSVLSAPFIWALIARPLRIQARKETDQFNAVLDSLVDAVISFDERGVILSFNPSSQGMFGYTDQETSGQNIAALIPGLGSNAIVTATTAESGTGILTSFETSGHAKNGACFPVAISISRLEREGHLIFIAIIQDISPRKLAEEEVRRLNAELEQRVAQRTMELLRANEQCQQVIVEQGKAEEGLWKSREELRNLSQHLQVVREEERTAIAREIHDELGQLLTALKMDVSWLQGKLPAEQLQLVSKTREMTKHIDGTIKTVQRISAELRPGILDDLGLTAAIEWQAQEFQKKTGIMCEINSRFDCSRLDRGRATAFFRIFQETLTNVCRHAEATLVRVTMSENGEELLATVTDNGKGISQKKIRDPRSFGLIGMRERVRYFGGEVQIGSLPEGGTSVQVTIPLSDRKKEQPDDKNTHSG
jgi:PAS domain S-box-containing protein